MYSEPHYVMSMYSEAIFLEAWPEFRVLNFFLFGTDEMVLFTGMKLVMAFM